MFDTVEVNSTFYRLAKPKAVAGWVEQTPPDFVFAAKASQYLTHMKRLTDIEQGIGRFYEAIAPLAASPKLGPILWQLPERFGRDLSAARRGARPLPEAGTRSSSATRAGSRTTRRSSCCAGTGWRWPSATTRQRPWQPWVATTDWSFVRFHYGARGRRGNYSEPSCASLAPRVAALADEGYVYFNNDWEGFAVKNALRLRGMCVIGS